MFNVLIVDDETIILESIKHNLVRMNNDSIGEIQSCESGEQAIEVCQHYKPHIVITDIRMTGMNGIELITALTKLLDTVRFIVLSGYDDYDYMRNAFREGAIDYLLKPLLYTQFKKAIDSICLSLKKEIQTNASELIICLLQNLETSAPNNSNRKEMEYKLHSYLNTDYIRIGILGFHQQLQADEKYEISQQCNIILEQCLNHNILTAVSEHNLIIVFETDSTTDEYQVSLINRILLLFTNKLTVAAALSRIGLLNLIPDLYMEAKEALTNRITKGYGKIYYPEITQQRFTIPPNIIANFSLLLNDSTLYGIDTLRKELIILMKNLPARQLHVIYDYLIGIIKTRLLEQHCINTNITAPNFYHIVDFQQLIEIIIRQTQQAIHLIKCETPTSYTTIEQIKAYIAENFNKNISLTNIAEKYCMSYTHLSHLIGKSFGMSFSEYVTTLRMDYSVKLLQNPSLSVQDVAVMSGYDNLFSFSRAFKNKFGLSPMNYRKRTNYHPEDGIE